MSKKFNKDSTRRNKVQTRRPALIPMMREKRDQIALRIGMSIEHFIAAPSFDTMNEVISDLLVLTLCIDSLDKTPIGLRSDPMALAICKAQKAIGDVDARHDRTGAVNYLEFEAIALRAAMGVLDVALARVPYNVYQAARIFEREAYVALMKAKHAGAIDDARRLIADSEAASAAIAVAGMNPSSVILDGVATA